MVRRENKGDTCQRRTVFLVGLILVPWFVTNAVFYHLDVDIAETLSNLEVAQVAERHTVVTTNGVELVRTKPNFWAN